MFYKNSGLRHNQEPETEIDGVMATFPRRISCEIKSMSLL